MDFVFVGALGLFFIVTVAFAIGCAKLGGQP